MDTRDLTVKKEIRIRPGWLENISVLSLLAAVVFVLYGTVLRGDFVYDDVETIITNKVITQNTGLMQLYRYSPTRFIPNLSFLINYQTGGLDTTGFHLVNILLHIFTGFSVFLLLKSLINLSREGDSVSGSVRIALTASLLFIVHPIQTEAVSFISQRSSLLAALFYILVIFFFLKAVTTINKTGKKHLLPAVFYYFLSIIIMIFGLFTKENSYTVPLAILLTEICVLPKLQISHLKKILLSVPYFLITLIVFLIIIGHGSHTTGEFVRGVKNIASTSQPPHLTNAEYALTELNVIRTYFRLLILPVGQNVLYDYKTVKSLKDPTIYFSVLLILFILGAGIYAFRRNRPLTFGVFFFFITISLESSFIRLVDVIAEHRLYLPSVGFFLIAAVFYNRYFQKILGVYSPGENNRKDRMYLLPFACLSVIILFLGVMTYRRNQVWKSQIALWSDTVMKSPNQAKAHNNLGVSLALSGNLTGARNEFKKAVLADSTFPNMWVNLGSADLELGELTEAEDAYNRALALDPGQGAAYDGLGLLYEKTGKTAEAISNFNRALNLNPQDPIAVKGAARLADSVR